jgi:hypothetical protein
MVYHRLIFAILCTPTNMLNECQKIAKEPTECIKLSASSQRKMAESQKSPLNTADLDKNRQLSDDEASILDMTKEEYYFPVLGLGHLRCRKALHCFHNTYESIRLHSSNKVGSAVMIKRFILGKYDHSSIWLRMYNLLISH